MKTLKKILFAGLFAMATYTGMNAQVQTTSGYNAVQTGFKDDGQLRGRMYTNAGIRYGEMSLGVHGLNEAGRNYMFGRETLRVGASIPVDAIYTTRLYGESIGHIKQIDEGTGVRLNNLELDINGTKFIDYGWIDLVKHFGNDFKGMEAVIFAGKSIGQGNLEATLALKNNGQKYLELEALTPTIDAGVKLRAYGRVEMPNTALNGSTYVAGLQAQL